MSNSKSELPETRTARADRPGAAAFVDEAAQDFEQIGDTLYFVQHDQPVGIAAQEQRRIGQPGAVFGLFEVKVERWGCSVRHQRARQSGLADLPGAEQGHGQELAQPDYWFLKAVH